MVDGKNTPFRNDNEDKSDDVAASNDSDADGNHSESKIKEDMHERTEEVTTFADENIICHIVYYSKET